MATLKISDLSVGDWVRYDDRICQIAEIHQLSYNFGSKEICSFPQVTLYYEDDMPTYQESVPFKDIHPIPITAEILGKNGWRILEKEVLGEDYEYEGGERVWDDENRSIEICEEKQEVFWYSWSNEYYMWRLEYVHQLQHLIRLAGVDKEINL